MGSDTEDALRPEYNLKSLRVREVGPQRTGFAGYAQLAPDVAKLHRTMQLMDNIDADGQHRRRHPRLAPRLKREEGNGAGVKG